MSIHYLPMRSPTGAPICYLLGPHAELQPWPVQTDSRRVLAMTLLELSPAAPAPHARVLIDANGRHWVHPAPPAGAPPSAIASRPRSR